MDSKELVELRNLIATAQLPWRAALCDVVRDDPNDDEPWTVAHCGPGEGMEAVIVGAVNALPSLLDHIAAQDARIEALEGAWNDMLALLEDAPELNPSNYDHDQVCLLNNQMIQAWQLAHSMRSIVTRTKLPQEPNMQTPLERAARALCELHIRNVRRHDTALSELEKMLPGSVNYAWEDFLPQARAVLQAIREPSMAMKLAGAQKITAQMPRVGPQADYDAANDSWQAMLDTALKDE